MDVAPLDACRDAAIGSARLPRLAPHHIHVGTDSTALVVLAQAVNFVKDKAVDPTRVLRVFSRHGGKRTTFRPRTYTSRSSRPFFATTMQSGRVPCT